MAKNIVVYANSLFAVGLRDARHQIDERAWIARPRADPAHAHRQRQVGIDVIAHRVAVSTLDFIHECTVAGVWKLAARR